MGTSARESPSSGPGHPFYSNIGQGGDHTYHEVPEFEKGFLNLTLGICPTLRQFLILVPSESPGELKNPRQGLIPESKSELGGGWGVNYSLAFKLPRVSWMCSQG